MKHGTDITLTINYSSINPTKCQQLLNITHIELIWNQIVKLINQSFERNEIKTKVRTQTDINLKTIAVNRIMYHSSG